jgi:hypothetical protein
LATSIGDPPNHGCDLDLCGLLPFSLLVVATNDPFGCGHNLDRHLPSFLSLLKMLVIFLIMVMILVFMVLLLFFSWLQLLVIFVVVVMILIFVFLFLSFA